jgi:hypothetical protein
VRRRVSVGLDRGMASESDGPRSRRNEEGGRHVTNLAHLRLVPPQELYGVRQVDHAGLFWYQS